MAIRWTYPNDTRIEADGEIGDMRIWITESSNATVPNQRWYWLIRDSDYAVCISDHCSSDEDAAAAIHHWLTRGEEAIRNEWAHQQLAEIDKIIAKLGKHAPQAALQMAGYAQGRQDGYEAARQRIAEALDLAPQEQLDMAKDARIDAESMVDFERDYAAILEDQLGDARTIQRAMTQIGPAIIAYHVIPCEVE